MSCKTYDPCLNNKINQIGSYAAVARQSAESALTSATNANNYLTQVTNIFNDFDERYLGAKASDPNTDNQGNPLQEGALYWNSVSDGLFVWDGSVWIALSTGFDEFTNFLATGTTNARNLVTRMSDWINVKDFGAKGDWDNATQIGTDDTAAIQAALDYAISSGKRSKVFFPSGKYRTTNTITISSIDSGIIGNGSGLPTTIVADHNNGPVIKIIAERQCVENLTISSSTARTNGSAGVGGNINCGILHSPGTGLARFVRIRNVVIGGQPSHGLVAAGTINGAEYSLLNIINNKGHGLVFSNGSVISNPSIVAAAGLAIVSLTYIFDNEGNGIVVGGENESGNRPVRIDFKNCEIGSNASNPAVRKSLFQADVFGSQITFNTCAFSSTVSVAAGGVKIAGNGLFLNSNRFLTVSKAIDIENYAEFPTKGVYVNDIHVTDIISQLIPGIDINNSASGIYVDSENTLGIGALVSKDRSQKNGSKKVIYKVNNQIINNSNTLTADNELKFSINKDERKNFKFVIFYTGEQIAGLKLNISRPAASSIVFGPPSSLKIDTSNTIAIQQTVGVGGTITVGCLYPEKRTIEIVGTVITNGVAGDVQLFWSQNIADASNLTISGESYLEYF